MFIRAPPQRFLRLKIFVFLSAICIFSLAGTYMFASYIDTASKNNNYLTLGFHHVYVVSERTHESRRREMARLMRFQGILFGFYPATSPHDIDNPDSYTHWVGEDHWARPMANHTEPSELLAHFRTHMNIINDVVRLQLPSALVLADDVDLELDVKQQMHAIVETLPTTWEILFLAHCGPPETLLPSLPSSHDRLFVASGTPACSFAYALTYQAAYRLRRVLNNMWPSPQKSFDHVLGDMIRPLYIEAYAIEPPLVAKAAAAAAAPAHSQSESSPPPLYSLRNSTLIRLGHMI
ncbi:hypothetical protein IWW48_000564 [Coemansia sp. RSA 1200]|nr:hypothetical protein IWW48_000564 [Coemansia sp. RSA 1200]